MEGGAFLNMVFLTTSDVNIHASNCQIWYQHPNKENTKVRPEMMKLHSKILVGDKNLL